MVEDHPRFKVNPAHPALALLSRYAFPLTLHHATVFALLSFSSLLPSPYHPLPFHLSRWFITYTILNLPYPSAQAQNPFRSKEAFPIDR